MLKNDGNMKARDAGMGILSVDAIGVFVKAGLSTWQVTGSHSF